MGEQRERLLFPWGRGRKWGRMSGGRRSKEVGHGRRGPRFLPGAAGGRSGGVCGEEIPLYRHAAKMRERGGGHGLRGGDEEKVLGRQTQLLCLLYRPKGGADPLQRRRGAGWHRRETYAGGADQGRDPQRSGGGDQIFRRRAAGDGRACAGLHAGGEGGVKELRSGADASWL